jgi:hypothetical protein
MSSKVLEITLTEDHIEYADKLAQNFIALEEVLDRASKIALTKKSPNNANEGFANMANGMRKKFSERMFQSYMDKFHPKDKKEDQDGREAE